MSINKIENSNEREIENDAYHQAYLDMMAYGSGAVLLNPGNHPRHVNMTDIIKIPDEKRRNS